MIVLRLLALALFAVIPTHAQTALRDGLLEWAENPVPSQSAAAQALEFEFGRRYGPRPQVGAAGGPVDEEARKRLIAQYDTAIKQFEETLAKLKPDDPQRAQLQTALDAIRKARDDFAAGRTGGGSPPAAAAAPPVKKAAAPVGVSAALANARALVQAGAGAKALANLAGQPELKTARGAVAAAASAALADKPVAALAALLVAHEREPNNPTHLVNAAGLLSLLGMAWEALSFLDAADALKVQPAGAMGLNGTAIALNNRGHALLAVGKAAEAEAVLRRAATLEPLLAEARTNLAMALRAQNKHDEAARFFAAGARRSPGSAAPAPASSGQGSQPGAGTPPPAPGAQGPVVVRRPAAEVYDLSRGIGGHLPTIRYGKTAREHEALVPRLEAMVAAIEAREKGRLQRFQQLAAQPARTRVPAPNSPGRGPTTSSTAWT